jgi:hypothetical protein
MAKATHCDKCERLEQIPNIGRAMAEDFRLMGIHKPLDLRGRDAFELYQRLSRLTGQHQDPCVLDTFMAAIDFMQGAPPKPWWDYTPLRKAQHGQLR